MAKTLLFAFAQSDSQPLPALRQEFDKLNSLYIDGQRKDHYNTHWIPYSSKTKLVADVSLYKDDLLLFHYSGHAGPDALLLDDEIARAEGVAHLLQQCPNLKVVILNGCATKAQAEALLTHVPFVVASSSPVDDTLAKQFSIALHQELVKGKDLEAAFRIAETLPMMKSIPVFRDILLPEGNSDTPIWGLFTQKGGNDHFQLPRGNAGDKKQILAELAAKSCDRKPIVVEFSLNWDDLKITGNRIASYLLLDRPESQMRSLLIRLVIENKLYSHFPGADQMKFTVIEFSRGSSLERCKALFRTALNKYAETDNYQYLREFAAYYKPPSFHHDRCIPLPFRIEFPLSAWASVVQPFLHWVFQDFLSEDTSGISQRKLLFFFSLKPSEEKKTSWYARFGQWLSHKFQKTDPYIRLHEQMQDAFHDKTTYPIPITVLPPPEKVKTEHLDTWYEDFIETNETRRQEYIKDLKSKLKGKEPWGMSAVEVQLEAIVEEYQNKRRGI